MFQWLVHHGRDFIIGEAERQVVRGVLHGLWKPIDELLVATFEEPLARALRAAEITVFCFAAAGTVFFAVWLLHSRSAMQQPR